ncbi:restriction endonuclease subunit S [Enterobacter cloacae]|uniref:restriction endonuclease subunit S n=1 Tax=Enterobacter cloacae complex TaxID=354276 RepID=UPI002147663A|nr:MULTISPECIES: restriction endonuclease subunit S [Enterobacter cloacae complex]MCR6730151.1 restriction endonuclease subunit S [Enterobacter cloacae]UUR76890.1 restriction endonuclease subunit S [Enterobacter cloacae complex sp. R_G8]
MTSKQRIKFGDICREVKITTKDPIADGYERYIGLEHLDSGSLKIKRWGIIEEDNPSFTRVFKKGHILFGKRRPYLKKAAIAEFDGVCSGDIIVLESNQDEIVSTLLPFILQKDLFWDHAIKTSSGSLSPRTKFTSLKAFELTIPSRSEQVSVSNLLKSNLKNYALGMDALDTLAVYRQKLIDSFFERFSSYPQLPLVDLISIKNGYAYSGKNIGDEETDSVIVTPGNFHLGGGYNASKDRFYSGDVIRDFKLRGGDLIVNMTDLSKDGDTLGLPAFIPESSKKYLHNQRVGLVEFRSQELKPSFLFMFMCSTQFRRKIVATSSGTTVRHTSVAKLLDFNLPIPPVELQISASNANKHLEELKCNLQRRENIYRSIINTF